MFRFNRKATLTRVSSKDWRVLAALTLIGQIHKFTVPVGFITDLASIPKMFRWLFNTYGSYTEAAILHDLLWRLDIGFRKGLVKFLDDEMIEFEGFIYPEYYLVGSYDVDGLFRKAMKGAGTPFLVRWYIWFAVRLAAIVGGRAGAMQWFSWLQMLGLVSPLFILPASFFVFL